MSRSISMLWRTLVQCMCILFIVSVFAQTAFAVCGDGVLDQGEQCDDGRLDDGDGCSSTCVIENPSGCADGEREGFVSGTQRYAYIAGCGGGWSLPGARSIPNCNLEAGDDSQNPTGAGCSAADLCAVGWHVCGSTDDVRSSLGTNGTCNDAADPNAGSQYYATQVSGPGSGNCSSNAVDTNDNFGCGNVGSSPNGSCSPLNRFSNNLCSALPAAGGWNCSGATGVTEQTRIRKTLAAGGGVMCCFGPGLRVTINTPGTITNMDRPVVSGTTDAPDGSTVSIVFPDQSIATTTANNGQWTINWPGNTLALVEGVESTLEASVYSTSTGFSGTRSKTTYVLCGNGVPLGQEQCDDGNTTNGDGCDEFCQFEVCGNGKVQANEACDDGNLIGGDGCSTMCAVETGYTCPTDGGQCLTVDITSPANNSSTQTEPMYAGTATENAEVTLIIKDNTGMAVRTAIVQADQNGDWTAVAQNLPDGTYTLDASVSTTGGTQTDTVTFTIDNTAPMITISAPTDGTVTTNNRPTIEGTISESANIVIEIRDSNNMVVQTLAALSLNGIYDAVASSLIDGTYTATAIATDNAGNTASASTTFTVDTATFVFISTPANNSVTNDNTPTVTGTKEDGSTLVIEVRDSNNMIVETLTSMNTSGSYSEDLAQLADGVYTITATATDALGNTDTTSPVVLTVDTTTMVAITGPADGSTSNDTTADIQGTAEPGADLTVNVTDTNGNVVFTTTLTADGTTGAWGPATTPMLGDGTYTIKVDATDGAGNTAGATSTFTVDTSAPPLDITAPTQGEVLSDNTPDVTGTTSPNATVSVRITDTNGNVIETLQAQADANGSWSITTATLADGAYTATATTSNAAGTVSTATVDFTIDTTAPTLTIDAPADNDVTNDNTPTISGTSDPNATVSVTIQDDGGNIIETQMVTTDAAGNWTLDASMLNDGDYTIIASVSDVAGNSSSAGPVNFSVDTTGPAVAITAPTDASTTNATQPPITGTADANTQVEITLTNAAGTIVFSGTVTSDANGDWTITPDNALADDTYTVAATATDATGNTTSATETTFTVDTTSPTVTITSPSTGDSTEDTTPTITGTAEPGATVDILVDGTKVGEATADDQGNWTFDVPNALDPGSHTIEATTIDAGGNMGSSGEITVNVVKPKAPITITSPAEGADVTGPDITITGTGEPGEEITVTVNGTDQTVTVDGDGNWSIDVKDVPDGETTITAKADDREETVTVTVSQTPDTTAYLLQGGCGSSTTGTNNSPLSLHLVLVAFGLVLMRVRRRTT